MSAAHNYQTVSQEAKEDENQRSAREMKQEMGPADEETAAASKNEIPFSTIFGLVLFLIGLNALLLLVVKPIFTNPHTKEVLSWEPYVVLNCVTISIAMMAFGLPADLVLMAVSGGFCAFKVIDTDDLLEGLSNSGVVAVAVLCVVSKAIDKTKALNGLMGGCLGTPSNTAVAMLRLAVPVVSLGTVFNNTPLVAVMIPIVKEWADKAGLEVSHFMMPLSFITMLSACITTMGSSTNLLAVDLVPEAEIAFLDMAPVGLVVMVVGVLYCAFVGPILLPSRGHVAAKPAPAEEKAQARLSRNRYEVKFVVKDGPLVNQDVQRSGLLECLPAPARIKHISVSGSSSQIDIGDGIFLTEATAEDVAAIQAVPGVSLMQIGRNFRTMEHHQRMSMIIEAEPEQLKSWALPIRRWVAAQAHGGWENTTRPLKEVVIPPGGLMKAKRTSMVGNMSLRDLQEPLSEHFCTLVAVRGAPLNAENEQVTLCGGEVLLVEAMANSFHEDAFMMAIPVAEGQVPFKLRTSPLDALRPGLSVLGLATCVLLSAMHIASLDAVALLVGLSAILNGTMSAKDFYGAINGPVLLTVAASFGVGEAFACTGLASYLATTVLGFAESGGPFVILGSVVVLALTLGVVVSNNTTVILLSPLVKDICRRQGLDLKMTMLAVIYAANLSFATPFSYQTNMMVMPHGGYVFMDYVRFGVPMMLLCGVVALVMTIVVWGD